MSMHAQIHRFRDAVAIHIGTGETIYLPPNVAKALGNALVKCAKDIKACDFVKSQFSTAQFIFDDGRNRERD